MIHGQPNIKISSYRCFVLLKMGDGNA